MDHRVKSFPEVQVYDIYLGGGVGQVVKKDQELLHGGMATQKTKLTGRNRACYVVHKSHPISLETSRG